MLAFEYEAVRHVLTAPQIERRTAPYIRDDDFDFVGLANEAATMSGGEALLVGVAHELWFAERQVGLWEIVRRLDADAFARVIGALTHARGPVAVGEEARLAA